MKLIKRPLPTACIRTCGSKKYVEFNFLRQEKSHLFFTPTSLPPIFLSHFYGLNFEHLLFLLLSFPLKPYTSPIPFLFHSIFHLVVDEVLGG